MIPEMKPHKQKVTKIRDRSANLINIQNLYKMEINNGGIDNKWTKIKQPSLSELILKSYSDLDTKKILNVTSKKPITIPKILDICGIPNTVGYRKINWLIKEGMIIPTGYVTIQKKKKVRKYKSIFEEVRISINMKNTRINVKFNKS